MINENTIAQSKPTNREILFWKVYLYKFLKIYFLHDCDKYPIHPKLSYLNGFYGASAQYQWRIQRVEGAHPAKRGSIGAQITEFRSFTIVKIPQEKKYALISSFWIRHYVIRRIKGDRAIAHKMLCLEKKNIGC